MEITVVIDENFVDSAVQFAQEAALVGGGVLLVLGLLFFGVVFALIPFIGGRRSDDESPALTWGIAVVGIVLLAGCGLVTYYTQDVARHFWV